MKRYEAPLTLIASRSDTFPEEGKISPVGIFATIIFPDNGCGKRRGDGEGREGSKTES